LSGGSLEQASQFANPEVREFRGRWLNYLAAADDRPFAFAKELTTFVDAAGKEAPPRRARLKHVAQMAATLYRGMIGAVHGGSPPADPVLSQAIQTALERHSGDTERLANCLDRCLELENQIEANANLATLADSWLDDLAQLRILP
jgi:DNA polymerase-3 subunit delta'